MILDTHVAVWITEEMPLRANARAQIARSAKAGTLGLSAISGWEIATLIRHRRLRVNMTADQYVRSVFALPGIHEIPVSAEIACAAGDLPDACGGDPADRIIIATASFLGLPIATRDDRIIRFAKENGAFSCVPV